MNQEKKHGELYSMNSERPQVIHIFEEGIVFYTFINKDNNRQRFIKFKSHQRQSNRTVSLLYLIPRWLSCPKEPNNLRNLPKLGFEMEINLKHGDHVHLLCQKGKKVAEKDVIAFMFIKCENKKYSTRKSSKCRQALTELFTYDLTCIICSEMYYEGVAVAPCGHVFCGYCLEQWEQQQNGDSCPICRLKMRNITQAFQINKIISTFFEVNPDVELNKKPNNKYFLQAQNYEKSDSDSDISVSEDSDSDFENIENEVIRRIQINPIQRRQFDAQQARIPQGEQQPYPVIQRINQFQNNQQNIQQNANPQYNGQDYNAVVQNRQAQDVQNQQRQLVNDQANQQRIQQLLQVGYVNQRRVNPNRLLNQAVQQNQQGANQPAPVVVPQQIGQLFRALNNPPQNQAAQQIQVRVNINHPIQQIMQVPRQQDVQFQIQLQNQIPQIVQPQQECRSCHAEYKGFKCQPFTQHTQCHCLIKMPKRDLDIQENANLKMFCQVCKDSFCKYYYGQQCEKQHQININELSSYKEGFDYWDPYFNRIERQRIHQHLQQRDPAIIFDFIMEKYIDKKLFYFQKNKALFENVQNEQNELLLPKSPVCTNCIRDVIRQIVFRYVQTVKYDEIQFMLPDCWYGINCQKQKIDYNHQRDYNHICEQTKFD